MQEFLQLFSTRELSVLFWSIVTLFLFIVIAPQKCVKLLKPLFTYKTQISFFLLLLHSSALVYILYLFNFWEYSFLKNTLFWLITTASVLSYNINKTPEVNYFKQIIKVNITMLIFIEFITSFYTFNLTTEFILIPIFIFTFLLHFTTTKQTIKSSISLKLRTSLEKVLIYLSVSILIFTSYKTITLQSDLFTISSLKSFLLPILLTFLTLPFFYFLALAINYQTLFRRINSMMQNGKMRRELKKSLLSKIKFDLIKLNSANLNFGETNTNVI